MNFDTKIMLGKLTIDDQDEAITKPNWAYEFYKNIPGANLKLCQDAACQSQLWAYMFAANFPEADIKYCQQAASTDIKHALLFIKKVPGASFNYFKNIIFNSNIDSIGDLQSLLHVINASDDYNDRIIAIEKSVNYINNKAPQADNFSISEFIYSLLINEINVFIPEEAQLFLAEHIEYLNNKFTSQKAIDKWTNLNKMRLACE